MQYAILQKPVIFPENLEIIPFFEAEKEAAGWIAAVGIAKCNKLGDDKSMGTIYNRIVSQSALIADIF